MNNLLYIVAIICLIGWILGFFAFSAHDLIHILLFLAFVALSLRIIRGSRSRRR